MVVVGEERDQNEGCVDQFLRRLVTITRGIAMSESLPNRCLNLLFHRAPMSIRLYVTNDLAEVIRSSLENDISYLMSYRRRRVPSIAPKADLRFLTRIASFERLLYRRSDSDQQPGRGRELVQHVGRSPSSLAFHTFCK